MYACIMFSKRKKFLWLCAMLAQHEYSKATHCGLPTHPRVFSITWVLPCAADGIVVLVLVRAHPRTLFYHRRTQHTAVFSSIRESTRECVCIGIASRLIRFTRRWKYLFTITSDYGYDSEYHHDYDYTTTSQLYFHKELFSIGIEDCLHFNRVLVRAYHSISYIAIANHCRRRLVFVIPLAESIAQSSSPPIVN